MSPAASVESRIEPKFSISDGLWAGALACLAAGQLLIGTAPYFTLLVVLFTVAWIACIKVVGGVKTLTGAAIGYMGFQHVVCAQFAKLFMGQRPDTPLLQPILTMEVYLVGIIATLFACLLANIGCFRRLSPMLPAELSADKLKVLAYLSVALMVVRYLGSPQVGLGGIRFLMNFDFITPMAAALVTAYQVVATKGKKFLHPLSYICLGVPFMVSMIGFQRKEAVLSFVIILAVAVAYGYRFKAVHFLSGIALLYFFQFIFFPFALYYRSSVKKTSDIGQNFARAWDAMAEVIADPLAYQDEDNFKPTTYDATRLLYYNQRPSPTLDRMTTIIITDALVHVAQNSGTFGWKTIAEGFDMVVPSIFNRDKKILGTSNWIAQQAPGMVSPSDQGTQITMGYFAEAYLSFKFVGVFFVSFTLMLVFLILSRWMMGDQLKNNLWTCSWIVTVPWTISESPVQGNIILIFQAMPLFVALGLLFLILANSLSRSPDPDRDRLPDKPVFEEEGLRMAG